jgi:hypothetical protein
VKTQDIWPTSPQHEALGEVDDGDVEDEDVDRRGKSGGTTEKWFDIMI